MSDTKPKIFVSHALEDLDEVDTILYPLKYLPFKRYMALNDRATGNLTEKIKQNLEESDFLLPYITENSYTNRWVNQEIGYGIANDTKVIPIFEDSSQLKGFVENTEGVRIDRENPHDVTFEIVSRLRTELSSSWNVGWYLEFRCMDCEDINRFQIERTQDELYSEYDDEEELRWYCSCCGQGFVFHAASLQLLRMEDS